ncbi:MAG: SCP2 sterol-binding domain-containing protein [Acidobacteriota bacterium]|nr:SCP2 sterol-binding domain-containing protein [Blastocatellia bacterium]MDW8411234.1 SCP2 sterol-binding domain-containing protein [Acidobacteriota bacterium]
MIKYYTKAWQDECVRRMQAPEFEAKVKKLNGLFVFRVLDCPDGYDRTMQWTFSSGKLVDVKYAKGVAPWQQLRDEPFSTAMIMRATCPYQMMAALNKGEISPLKALTSPHYKLEGNKALLMQLMPAFNAWNQLCSAVEVTYEYSSEEDEQNEPPAASS